MSADYSFDVDVPRSIVKIAMGGFFTPGDILGFVAARDRAHARLTCRPNAHCTINDLRELKIQSQDSVAAFQRMLANPEYRSRKLAFIIAPTLARPQLLRAMGSRGARTFASYAEAEAWVLAEDDEAVAA